MSLYTTPGGYRLFEARSYTSPVRAYRRAERRLLRSLAKSADTLVELGCGKAEHYACARAWSLQYLGVDPSRPYLDEAEATLVDCSNALTLCCGGAEEVDRWAAALPAQPGKLLVFMPFNCLGNVPDPGKVLRALGTEAFLIRNSRSRITPISATFLFSVFTDSPEATRTRLSYYSRSGLRVRRTRSSWGIRVTGGGLDSTGFNPRKLRHEARRAGLRLHSSPLGEVGIALWGSVEARPLRL